MYENIGRLQGSVQVLNQFSSLCRFFRFNVTRIRLFNKVVEACENTDWLKVYKIRTLIQLKNPRTPEDFTCEFLHRYITDSRLSVCSREILGH